MTWSPDHPIEFYDPNLAPHLAEVAAVAGSAVCRGLVDLYMDVAIKDGAIEPYSRNGVIFQSFAYPASTEAFCLSSFDTSVRCHTTRTAGSENPATTSLVLVPDLDRPGELRMVKLREPGEEVMAIEEAPPGAMLAMARLAAEAAGPLEQERSQWKLTGDNSNVDMFMVGAAHLVPVVGQLVRTIGNFAAQKAPEGLLVSSRLKVDVGSSGRVYGPTSHTVQVQTNNTKTGTKTDFTMRFKFSAIGADGEFSVVRCQLDRKDPNGEVTKDILLQRGRQLVRIRSGTDNKEAGEYPADDQTILNMADAAMSVNKT